MTTESHIYLETMEAGSTVWSDYDGDTIYGDYEVVFTENPPESGIWSKQIVEKTAYLPGIAQMDSETGYVVYFHTDQIGTTRVITSSSLKRPHRYVSTAFGERVHTDGTVGTRYQYAGAYGYETLPAWGWDAVLEEYGYQDDENVPFLHLGYRYYNPETGRFLQRDPIGIDGGLNTYAYCGNAPIGYIDPEGLTSLMRPEGIAALIEAQVAQGGGRAIAVKIGPKVYQVVGVKIVEIAGTAGEKTINLLLEGGRIKTFECQANSLYQVSQTCTNAVVVAPKPGACGVTGLEAAPVMLLVLARMRRRRSERIGWLRANSR